MSAFQLWSNVANIHFYDCEALGLPSPAQLVLAEFDVADPRFLGQTSQDPNAVSVRKTGQIDLVIDPQTTSFTAGGSGYQTAIHEVGHAISLTHPFGVDENLVPTTDPRWLDQGLTVMSYNQAKGTSGADVALAASPMIYDIAAVQYLYGANTGYLSTNTVYGWVDNIGPKHVVLDGAQKAWTIWDAGGSSDVIDISANTYGSKIDLRGGVDTKGTTDIKDDVVRFSEIKKAVDGQLEPSVEYIAIAFDPSHYNTDGSLKTGKSGVVDIEKAIGGIGNDTLIGGYVPDRKGYVTTTLEGGAGNDLLVSYGGDYIYGGADNDTLFGGKFDELRGEAGSDTYWLNTSSVDDGFSSGTNTFIVYTGNSAPDNKITLHSGGVAKIPNTVVDKIYINEGAAAEIFGAGANDQLYWGGTRISGTFYQQGGSGYAYKLGANLYANGSGTIYDGKGNEIARLHLSGYDSAAGIQGSAAGITLSLNAGVAGNVGNYTALPFTANFVKDYAEPVLPGTAAADNIMGSFFADTITLLAGNDTVDGLTGNDTISGGTGSNSMTGGADKDTFKITTDTVAVTDTITDFNAAAGEVIDLSAFGTGQTIALTQIGANTSFTLGNRTVTLQNVAANDNALRAKIAA